MERGSLFLHHHHLADFVDIGADDADKVHAPGNHPSAPVFAVPACRIVPGLPVAPVQDLYQVAIQGKDLDRHLPSFGELVGEPYPFALGRIDDVVEDRGIAPLFGDIVDVEAEGPHEPVPVARYRRTGGHIESGHIEGVIGI